MSLRTLPSLHCANPKVTAYFCHMNNGCNVKRMSPKLKASIWGVLFALTPTLMDSSHSNLQCVRYHNGCFLRAYSMNDDFMRKFI